MTSPLRLAFFTGLLVAYPHIGFAQDNSHDTLADGPRTYINFAVELIELNSFAGESFNIFGEGTATLVLRGGAVLHRHFAVEGEAAIGADNKDGDGIPEYESRFAGYSRARLPFGDTGLEVFARAGYAVTNVETRNVIGNDGLPGASGKGLDGISYGAGIAFNFGDADQFHARLDYTEFNFGNNQDADAVSLSLGYNF